MLGITRLHSFFLLKFLIPVLAGLSPKDHMGPALVGETQNCLHKEYDQVKKIQAIQIFSLVIYMANP